MDDIIKPNISNNQGRYPLGMSSFSQKEREQFGQNLRLAMACIQSPTNANTSPNESVSTETSIRQQLKAVSQEISSQHADLLALLIKFDDVQGWKSSGASHCAAWMNFEIGISLKLSWEYLRVGRKIQRQIQLLSAPHLSGR